MGWFFSLRSSLARAHRNSETVLLLIILVIGMTILGLVTFPNFFCGRCYNLDVEIFKRIIDGYLNFKLYRPVHFFISVAIPAIPFYVVFGLFGIFLYQWLFMVFGAIGIYLYARELLPRARLWPVIQFFGMWGLYSALAGNIYIEVLGPMAIPYIFYSFHKRKWLLYGFSLSYLILSKEIFSLWAAFIAAGLWMLYRKRHDKKDRMILLFSIIISVILFLVQLLTSIYMITDTFFGDRITAMYRHLLADNPMKPTSYASKLGEIVDRVLCNWKYYLILLFEPTADIHGHQPQELIGIKSESHIAILLSGGWTFLINWEFLFMASLVYLYKFLSTDPQTWGTMLHYSIEYTVLLPLSVIWVMKRVPERKMWLVGISSAFLAHYMNYSLMEKRLSLWYYPEHMQWYSCIHYCPIQKYYSLKQAVAHVPENVPFYVDIRFMPYFNLPDESYHRMTLEGAEYAYLVKEGYFSFPLDSIQKLISSGEWKPVYNDHYVVVLRRNNKSN